ncbi:hypothetical protein FOHLNKBM_5787 [Methylobacterium longum]|uniref:PAS domain-containing protein n=1 Tax=Methylobacterium longum TaxID=767694 RepID=UPI001EE15717|nr:PAS domain-containing protein [Methylobacterium longum]GJE14712.1 hypothetical protein FOHLNKBM_5787 [Methylobacterium longum]
MPSLKRSARSLAPALDAAGFVGTWDWSVTTGQVVLDQGSAKIVAGDPALAGQIIDLDTALVRLHPDDHGWVMPKIEQMGRTCGTILAEYRVRAPNEDVRWLLDRGRVTRRPDGTVHGQGIWLDVTDLHQDDALEDLGPEHLIEMAATHCLNARELLQRSGTPMTRLLIDMLLLELGRGAAEHVQRLEGSPLH